jgi:hypothetical protein
MGKYSIIILLLCSFVSCNKPDETTVSCPSNSGTFKITEGGITHELQITTETQFSILYNWYGNSENNIVIDGVDQNNKLIYIEIILPGELTVGSHTFNSGDLGHDFMDIALDTSSYYTSEVTYTIEESDLDSGEGVYKPIKGSFSGTAHSYPWINGQQPTDNHVFSGEFCLNGVIM